MKESLQTLPKLFSREKKSSREKIEKCSTNPEKKMLTKAVPVDQQLIARHKEEMELKREMLGKIYHQEQQFNQTTEVLLENTTKFTDIVSGALQIMGVAFQQQRNNVMFLPGNDYSSNDVGFFQWMRQQNHQHTTWDG